MDEGDHRCYEFGGFLRGERSQPDLVNNWERTQQERRQESLWRPAKEEKKEKWNAQN
jgi:hypothetical protein